MTLGIFFAAVGVVLSVLRYSTYIFSIIQRRTKPHPLTWIGAGLMSGVAWVIQLEESAGPTIWVTGVVTLCCIGIGIVAFFVGEKGITKSDWISFATALVIIPVWIFAGSPLFALILVMLIELLNYYPTVRKSYQKPYEEDIISWSLSGLRWACATLAVTSFSFNSMAYPLFITICEIGLVAYLLYRRKMVSKAL